jgi:hypothetical protein
VSLCKGGRFGGEVEAVWNREEEIFAREPMSQTWLEVKSTIQGGIEAPEKWRRRLVVELKRRYQTGCVIVVVCCYCSEDIQADPVDQ